VAVTKNPQDLERKKMNDLNTAIDIVSEIEELESKTAPSGLAALD
jgi:hypothetical protein